MTIIPETIACGAESPSAFTMLFTLMPDSPAVDDRSSYRQMNYCSLHQVREINIQIL